MKCLKSLSKVRVPKVACFRYRAMSISVIIPTRNRCSTLANALHSLANQTIDRGAWEIVVVDNGSTDGSRATIKQFEDSIGNLRYLYVDTPGLHICRHVGFRESVADLLIYIDDDVEVSSNWLESIRNAFRDPKVALVGGKCLPKFESEPPDWLTAMWRPNTAGERVLGYLSLIDLGDEIKPVNPFYVFGCNFAIRRSVLGEAGGFHPDGMPQELIHFRGDGESYVSGFIQAKGYRALYHPGASVYHAVPRSRMTPAYFCRRAFNQGISDSFTVIRRSHGLDAFPLGASANRSASAADGIPSLDYRLRSRRLTEITRAVLRGARRLLIRDQPGPAPIDAAADARRALHLAIQAAHDQGYAYHQDCVSQSAELLDWVVKADYWDSVLPKVAGCDERQADERFSEALQKSAP